MPDGNYMLGGQPITMKNGKATLAGTDTLAGSSIALLDAVRNVVRFGLPLADAVYAATTAPAQAVGLGDVGVIRTGAAADLLLLDRDLALQAVFVDGVRISDQICPVKGFAQADRPASDCR
jgi:N-acetylglucosamine-6-phosphate deacetylase